MQLLSEEEYHAAIEQFGENFEAQMGAEAVRKCLNKVDLEQLMHDLEEQIENTRSKQTRKKNHQAHEDR
jgi:DNA-directed RNA polymerase subunit beta'